MVWVVTDKKSEFIDLTEELSKLNYSSKYFKNSSEAIKNLSQEKPEAFIIDADQSFISSFEFCWLLKTTTDFKKIKVFVFSKNQDEAIEIKAFESGADDFIRKPIREKSVTKRIYSRLKPSSTISKITIQTEGKANLIIDKESYSVQLNEIPITLSKKEFELLYLMAEHPGRIYTREEIFDKVWKKIPVKKDRTIDVHILRLRKKIGSDFFSTQKGIGYRFCA